MKRIHYILSALLLLALVTACGPLRQAGVTATPEPAATRMPLAGRLVTPCPVRD